MIDLMPKKKQKRTTTQSPSSSTTAIQVEDTILPETVSTQLAFAHTMDLPFPSPFTGSTDCDPKSWITNFELYSKLRGLNEEGRRAGFLLSMKEGAARWIQTISEDDTNVWATLKSEFIKRFEPTGTGESEKMKKIWSATQGGSETVRDFIDRITVYSLGLNLTENALLQAIQAGLKPSVRQYVARQQLATIKELTNAAMLAETTEYPSTASSDAIANAIQRLEDKIDQTHLSAISRKHPPEAHRPPSPDNRSVRYDDHSRDYPRYPNRRSLSTSSYHQQTSSRSPSPSPSNRRMQYSGNPRPAQRTQHRQDGTNFCYRCNGTDHRPEFCRHKNVRCRFCQIMGHIERACRKRQTQGQMDY